MDPKASDASPRALLEALMGRHAIPSHVAAVHLDSLESAVRRQTRAVELARAGDDLAAACIEHGTAEGGAECYCGAADMLYRRGAEGTTAEIVFDGDVVIRLKGWHLAQISYFGSDHMQLSGWLPEGWNDCLGERPRMLRATVPGRRVEPRGMEVDIEVKGYGDPNKFMKIQWPLGREGSGA